MQPLGRQTMKFPGKCSKWLGKGVRWWWEGEARCNKKTARQQAKKEIRNELQTED